MSLPRLRVNALRAGMAEVERAMGKHVKQVLFETSSGRALAIMSLVEGPDAVPPNTFYVEGDVLRSRRTTIIYCASGGATYAVRHKGKTFLIEPPAEVDSDLPRVFETTRSEPAGTPIVVSADFEALKSRIEAMRVDIKTVIEISAKRLEEEIKRRVEAEARIEDLLRKVGALEERLQISSFAPPKSKRATTAN